MRGMDLFSKFGLPLCGGLALLLLVPGGATAQDGDWPTYNHDAAGSRFNDAETVLGASNVGNAQVLWRFDIADASVSGTPVVVGGAVHAGDSSGRVWALSASNGKLLWKTDLPGASFSASALVTGNFVVIGSLNGARLYGLNRLTGAVKWVTVLDPIAVSAIFGSPTKVRDYVAVGVASNEETATQNPHLRVLYDTGLARARRPERRAIV
jgi:outer membrane protein assembly factor BamB